MIDVRPDISFIEELQVSAGSPLSTCMQCGACTASCALSTDQNVFPRRQMIMAAWGLKERLMSDPWIWACHQCGDCSVTCPRDVRPGDIVTSLRQAQYRHYSRPRFLAGWMQDPVFLPLLVAIPMIIITFILFLAGVEYLPEGLVNYSEFFPHGWLNGSFSILFLLGVVGLVSGIRKYWRSMVSMYGHEGSKVKFGDFISVVWKLMIHKEFRGCSENRSRSWSHLLVFYGFILLLFVTFFAILSTIFWDYPLSFFNPIKIAGNIGALMLFIGTTIMIISRLRKSVELRSGYSDWFFLCSFWLLTVSGIVVEAARFLNWGNAYHLYFFHLVMVWMIILYLPYTKFAHILFRTVGLVFIKGRLSKQ
jgi:quinone-modifying oxidoreductase subunit QmoC